MSYKQGEIREIFLQAVEIESPDERSAFLEHACGEATEFRRQVEALIVAHERPESLLDKAAVALNGLPGDTAILPPIVGRLEEQVGPYKLLEQIGEGGFGTVYRAEQQQPVRRQVALKVIKPGMDTREVIARFEAERQALALMDHPGIAHVLDAGATDSGCPYFVMELVRGIPITEYCDQCNLTTDDRLRLLVEVCHAVQHAHQKGIIHRDLKPSNVLVGMQDGRPAVKVIDFGVAKAINQRLTERTLMTGMSQLLGTPLYMSPEQAEMGPLDIDTRSDIYSLGVVLYELLTGTTPFERDRLKEASFDELRRIIREEEPPKPSTRISTLKADLLSTVAERHRTDTCRLRQSVSGDLDWIVMKALDKDRTRRYETANGLARDVERYLSNQPVEACPPSAAYRFGKFARRNRSALATIVLVAAALVIGTLVSTWQAIRATKAEQLADNRLIAETQARTAEAEQRKQAEAQQAAAEANLEKAKTTVDRYFTLVSEDKLLDVPGLQPLRKDLLESALDFYKDLSVERPDDPVLLADLAVTFLRLGHIYIALDRADDAVIAVRQALDAISRIQSHPEAKRYEPRLAGFWRGVRWTQGSMTLPRDPIAAFQTLLRFEATWQKLATEHSANRVMQSDLASIQAMIGLLLADVKGQRKQAIQFFRKARANDERLTTAYPDVHQYRGDLAAVSLVLAFNLHWDGKVDEARALIRQSVELAETLVKEHPDVPAYRRTLAEGLQPLSREIGEDQPRVGKAMTIRALDLAESLAREYPSMDWYRQLWHETVVSANVLAKRFEASGRIAEAEELFRDTMEANRRRARLFPAVERRELAEFQFGQYLARSGRLEEAEELYLESLEESKRLVEMFPDVPDYRMRLFHGHRMVGFTLWNMGKLDDALQQFEAAQTIIDRMTERNNNWNAGNRIDMILLSADRHANLQEWQDAAADFAKAARHQPKNVRPAYLAALTQLATGDTEGYRNTCASMLERFAATKDANTAHFTAWSCVLAADATDDFSLPIQMAKRAIEADPNEYAHINALGALMYRAGQYQEALQKLHEADALVESPSNAARTSPAYTWYFLAMTQQQLGNATEARLQLDRANEWTERALREPPKLEGGTNWFRLLTLRLLRDEAQQLIGKEATPVAAAADDAPNE